MITYHIVNEYTTKELADKVNKLLSEGWELQGGVSISASDDNTYPEYCQAMVLVTKSGKWFNPKTFEQGVETEWKRPFLSDKNRRSS